MQILKLFLMLLLTSLLSTPSAVFALQKGDPLPEISGTTIDGETFSISSLKGRPIILKVGTTWCPSCGQQSAAIDELRGFMTEQNIQFVDVFIQENEKKVRQYFKKGEYQLPDVTVLDYGDISGTLNIYLIPRLLLIDSNFLVYRDGDTLPSAALKKELQGMLTEK